MSFLSIKLLTAGIETIGFVMIYVFSIIKKVDSRPRLGVLFSLLFVLNILLEKSQLMDTLIFYSIFLGLLHYVMQYDLKSSCFYGVQAYLFTIVSSEITAINFLFLTGQKLPIIDLWNDAGIVASLVNLIVLTLLSIGIKHLFEQVRNRVGVVRRVIYRIRRILLMVCVASILWMTLFIAYLYEKWEVIGTIDGLKTLLFTGFVLLLFSNVWIAYQLVFHYCFQFRYRAVTAMAETDPLTGLLSRSAGMQLVKRSFSQAKLTGSRLTLVFIDVNDLKVVNDKHGHNSGDQLIAKISEVLKSNIRSSDSAMRFGGDEFVLILQDCPHYRAEEIMKKITVYLARFNLSGDFDFKLSISYGIAEYSDKRHHTVQELISEADVEMYKHKKKVKQRRE